TRSSRLRIRRTQASAWAAVVGSLVIEGTVPLAPTTEERNWAMAAHLAALVAVAGLPFGHIIGPLVVYLTQRERSAFVTEHAKASLNFQINVAIAAIILIIAMAIGWVTFIATISQRDAAPPIWALTMWFLTIAVFIAGAIGVLVFIILGTIAASKGEP